VINQLRAFLLERGLAPRAGRRPLARLLPALLEDAENGLSTRMRALLQQLRDEWHELEAAILRADREIHTIASTDAACQRLLQIPGIGPLSATAMIASIGHGQAFR
jgi:transposase